MVLFNYSTKELTAKVVYYGPGLCGKTTNLQFIHENLPESVRGKMLSLATKTDRTLFFDFLPIDLGEIRGMKTRVQLYTVPGQVFYNETRKLVLKGADGIVFVADSQRQMLRANVESIANLEENLKGHGMRLADMPHVIQFNKRDLPNLSGIEEMNSAINRYNAPFYESVATTGIGVQDTLKAIVKLVLLHLTRKYDPKTVSTSPPDRAGTAPRVAPLPETAAIPSPAPRTPWSEMPPAPRPVPVAAPPPAAPAASIASPAGSPSALAHPPIESIPLSPMEEPAPARPTAFAVSPPAAASEVHEIATDFEESEIENLIDEVESDDVFIGGSRSVLEAAFAAEEAAVAEPGTAAEEPALEAQPEPEVAQEAPTAWTPEPEESQPASQFEPPSPDRPSHGPVDRHEIPRAEETVLEDLDEVVIPRAAARPEPEFTEWSPAGIPEEQFSIDSEFGQETLEMMPEAPAGVAVEGVEPTPLSVLPGTFAPPGETPPGSIDDDLSVPDDVGLRSAEIEAPEVAASDLALEEVVAARDLFDDPTLEVTRLAAGEAREIVVPVEIGEGTSLRRFKLSLKLRLDRVD